MKSIKYLILIGLALGLSGCGSFSKSISLEPGVTAVPKESVQVGEFKNQTTAAFDFDYQAYYREALQGELAKHDIVVAESAEGLILETVMLEYQPGNAFKRWLMPAYGSTVCTVQVNVLDASDRQKLATINVRRSVSFGGAYTIGAYKTVFQEVAKAVVKQLDSQWNPTK